MSEERIYFDIGQSHPYDQDGNGSAPDGDWAVKAARGVLANLTDRRDIKRGFEQVDHGVRLEIVQSLAELIRIAQDEAPYLVWSNEHSAWWRANSEGYARSILNAGIYSRAEATDIADKSRNGWSVAERPDEIAVSLSDIPAKIRGAVLAYGGDQE